MQLLLLYKVRNTQWTIAVLLILMIELFKPRTKYNDENVYDCGVFVCLFADFIALDCAPIFDFDEEYINKCRELISLAIMNECAIDYNLND